MKDMDTTGGLSVEEKQRRAAAEIVRQKVVDSYKTASPIAPTSTSSMKKNPVTISEENWKKYHTAWQNYYQKYYSNYYSNAAREYVAKEKVKFEREKAEIPTTATPVSAILSAHETSDNSASSTPVTPNDSSIKSRLKQKIQQKASDRAKKSKKHKKLAPIIAGITVVILILFLQYNRLIFAPIMAYISPGESPSTSIEAVDPTVSNKDISPDPKLIIPKINVEVPITFGISADDVMGAMRTSVAHYRINGASAYPGEIGNTVITGHSAGDVYNNDPYKYIFSGLERLSAGDLIYVNYNSTRYTYRMTGSKVVEPTDVTSLTSPAEKPTLILVTCTPLGTSRYRLLIFAEQISPSYDNAPTASPSVVDKEIEETLPSNEKTFFESIWSWFTGNNS